MRAHLVDVSKYQVFLEPKGNLDGVIIRSGYGLMKDKKFVELTAAAKDIPVRGAYHYFSSNVPWEVQAKFFVEQVKDKGFHFYALDFERAFNNKSAGFASTAQKWMQYVADATGKKVVLYTNPSTYKDWLLPYGNWMIMWPLWVAQWPWFPKPETGRPNMTGMKRSDWILWQYSGDGNRKGAMYGVGSRDVDEDVSNGTVEEFYEWAGVEIPTEPPPDDDTDDEDTEPIPIPKSWLERLIEFIIAFIRNLGNG